MGNIKNKKPKKQKPKREEEESRKVPNFQSQIEEKRVNGEIDKLILKREESDTKASTTIRLPRRPGAFDKTPSAARLGLTSKERGFIITSCQRHSSRYAKLKNHARAAMKRNQVYIVYSRNKAIRKALNSRGWVEKLPPHSMNLTKLYKEGMNKSRISYEIERLLLSNLVTKHTPNFVWKSKDHSNLTLELNSRNDSIINKLKMDTVWVTKQGLASSIDKNINWFQIENVSEIYTPRTYNGANKANLDEFTTDFILTACISLLKWMLRSQDNDKLIYAEEGTIPTSILTFALNRCKEFILKKQNKDIDHNMRHISTREGNAFLTQYYKIIKNEELFENEIEDKVPLYTAYSKVVLTEIQKYRPQVKCEGYRDVWILKPTHCSRGRGIKLSSDLSEIHRLLTKSAQRKIIQKYIEEPLLIHGTKFDIRQYYIVTNTFPLTIWIYKDCYLKFSTQKYTLDKFHESIHLTNYAVQKRYKNCAGRSHDLPSNKMWSLQRYKEYLCSKNLPHIWDDFIYPSMKKCIIGVMLSCQEFMSPCKNRFELYGCDFVLDEDHRPWLIEINSCPDLNPTTKVTANICAAVVEDIVKVVIDQPKAVRTSTGNFELAYKQPYTTPIYRSCPELIVQGYSLPHDYFCRKSVVHEPIDESCDIEKEFDIQNTFKNLKSLYMDNPDYEKHNGKETRECAEGTNGYYLDDEIFGQIFPMEKVQSSGDEISLDSVSSKSSPVVTDDVSSISLSSDESVSDILQSYSDSSHSFFSQGDLDRIAENTTINLNNKNSSVILLPVKNKEIDMEPRDNAQHMIENISRKINSIRNTIREQTHNNQRKYVSKMSTTRGHN